MRAEAGPPGEVFHRRRVPDERLREEAGPPGELFHRRRVPDERLREEAGPPGEVFHRRRVPDDRVRDEPKPPGDVLPRGRAPMTFDLGAYMKNRAAAVDAALERVLPAETEPPETLHKAMRYSVFAGGKRLRPVLVIAGAEVVGGRMDDVMPMACAIELIHTYSLVHDDLPAMDDDDFRRGAPTNHKVFGEAMAILAGDALLTLAFRLVADNVAPAMDAMRLRDALADLADAAGHAGMVGGQVADLQSEGRPVGADALDYIHAHKTGALIRTSLRAGARLCGATPAQLRALSVAGAALGLAFQIIDDVLDVVSSSAELGKTAGKDQAQRKATYPAIHGLEASRARARHLIGEAEEALAELGPRAEPIRALGRFILERRA